jgi:hypothetical protein
VNGAHGGLIATSGMPRPSHTEYRTVFFAILLFDVIPSRIGRNLTSMDHLPTLSPELLPIQPFITFCFGSGELLFAIRSMSHSSNSCEPHLLNVLRYRRR